MRLALFATIIALAASCVIALTIRPAASASGGRASNCVLRVKSAALDPSFETADDESISQQAGLTYRGLWIWNTDILTDAGARRQFFTFAHIQHIGGAYLYAPDAILNNSDKLQDFIREAEHIGVETELLAGDPDWALTPNHPSALNFVQQAIAFTENITDSARPVGLHLDVEPYLLPEWDANRSSTITQYLTLLDNVDQELTASSTELAFIVDIPFWFDTITATYNSQTKPLSRHVQDIAARVVIMDYRDFAEGDDGIIFHAQNEMDYAQSIGSEVVIGVETNDVAPEPEKVTFFEEGDALMEAELALVKQHYQTSSAFRGFAIHDYSGYYALAPIGSLYLPVVLKGYSSN